MNLRDPKIEMKLFHIFIYLVDMTVRSSSVKVVTHYQYAKIRLMHADLRWRHDKVWPILHTVETG